MPRALEFLTTAKTEIVLSLGVLWIWFGHVLTPEFLSPIEHALQFATTALVFILACYRVYRVVFKGQRDPIDSLIKED